MMKKLFMIVMIGYLAISGINAQESKTFAGAGVAYGTEINNIGFYANGVYAFTDKWEVAPTLTFFLKKDYTRWSTFDVNAHYVFLSSEKAKLYGLAGLNFTFWKVKIPAEDLGYSQMTDAEIAEAEAMGLDMSWLMGEDIESKATEVGFNLGVGGRFPISEKISLQAETKYTLGNYGFLSLGAGVLYNF